jgi:(2R)-sulfolactate sulfo-lyase subunit alpha
MEGDGTIVVKALDPVPLGHKIALRDLEPGETILKYGHDIGKVVAAIGKGRHVHVHNIKTKRW